jgi:hypothetical protein
MSETKRDAVVMLEASRENAVKAIEWKADRTAAAAQVQALVGIGYALLAVANALTAARASVPPAASGEET